ncbi:MAG: UDP-2,3-diacylglucosamine diphosphatase [Thioalkalispiraceae bacterium]|jgi:UDP-2,3-diacylglucosamine hydrolase
MSLHFLSDLHLSAEQSALTQLFINYLDQHTGDADAVFILGDLFEVWLGDDMILPEYQPAIDAMQQLTRTGIPIYVMYGNRDFLMREQFEQLSGCQLINDPTIIDLYGTPTLLMHGDTLCTDDTDYLQFRRMVRDPQWQQQLLNQSPEQRLALAREYREKSQAAMDNKADEIMDVNQDEVVATMNKYQVSQLIHGHTHRPDTHHFKIDAREVTRIVLSDWHDHEGYVLVCSASGCQTRTIQI